MSNAEPKLTAGDAIFLSFLTWGPASPYDIKKAMQMSVSHFWSAAHSQVYQQASRLVRDGYLKEKDAPGARRKKVLTLTPRGRAAVAKWLRSPAAPPELRDESLAKLFFAANGDPKRTRLMLLDQRRHHADLLEEYARLKAMLEASEHEHASYQLDTLKLGIRVTQAYLDWIDETLTRIP